MVQVPLRVLKQLLGAASSSLTLTAIAAMVTAEDVDHAGIQISETVSEWVSTIVQKVSKIVLKKCSKQVGQVTSREQGEWVSE